MATNINGKEISAPIWGGHRPALLAPWSEIKKLGFRNATALLVPSRMRTASISKPSFSTPQSTAAPSLMSN